MTAKVFLIITAPTVALLISFAGALGDEISPYAGWQEREIKALSADQIAGYLEGSGQSMALPAELNHYPGPRHVLELASGLRLSEEQIDQAKMLERRMTEEAVILGRATVAKEAQLDHLFASGSVNERDLRQLVADIAELQGELRYTHLRAHVELCKVLSHEQVVQYDVLRGYAGAEGRVPHSHRKHKH